jgi:zinc transport system ATP-binding protein
MTGEDTPPPLLLSRALSARAGDRTLFEGLSLTVRRGELVVLTGPNGSGKSTLLRILLGLVPPATGEVTRAPGLRVGYVPQLDPGDPGLPFPARTVVAQGLAVAAGGGVARSERVRAALSRTGFQPPPSRRYTRLSGGERRRVLLARALVGDPDLLALDEPTAGVDPAGEREAVDLILSAVRGGSCGAVWVCHALHAVEAAADRVVRLGSDL